MNRFRGRSGAGSVPVHGLAPQNLSPDTHVDVYADSDEDRGSTPLASTFALRAKVSVVALAEAAERITQLLRTRIQPFGPKPGSAVRIGASVIVKCADKLKSGKEIFVTFHRDSSNPKFAKQVGENNVAISEGSGPLASRLWERPER